MSPVDIVTISKKYSCGILPNVKVNNAIGYMASLPLAKTHPRRENDNEL